MGKLQPISKRSSGKGMSITIGIDGRMYLSQAFRNVLAHNGKQDYFLFYDGSENRIGIAKEYSDPNVEAFTFGSTGECKVVSFIEDCEIHMTGKPEVWLYEGKEDGIYVFYQRGRKRITLQQEKNGNLERVK